MDRFTKRAKKIRVVFIASSAMLLGFSWLGGIFQDDLRNNYYTVFIDGEKIASSTDYEQVQNCIKEARKRINSDSTELSYVDADIEIKQSRRYVGTELNDKEMTEKIYESLCDDIDMSKSEAYIVNIDGYVLTMSSLSDIEYLFNSVREKYDNSKKFSTNLYVTEKSGHTTIACDVSGTALQADLKGLDIPTVGANENGANVDNTDNTGTIVNNDVEDNSDVNAGVMSVTFGEKIEIVPCYVGESQIENINNAIDKMVENNNSELSVLINERQTYEVEYSVETEYVYNDKLYNTEQNVLREGNSGTKKIVADVVYKNGEEISREIVKEDIVEEAVSKIIEVGTAVPPTYIKPIKGGTLSSTFGERWGTLHKGIDWACSIGTEVMASCDGSITQAGWVNGYGYCVTMKHSDGKFTRYGHLSQVLVSVGQTVSQGETIALSGNTGNSTGPHVHFEIIVDGEQENPFNYLD
jgi:murein DD-endopeptidase MepM/ murein hydrolase activator NlpD